MTDDTNSQSWKKPSRAFFHVVDRGKRRGFPGSKAIASCSGRRVPRSAHPAVGQRDVRMSWIRLLAVATAAVILASCRALPSTTLTVVTADPGLTAAECESDVSATTPGGVDRDHDADQTVAAANGAILQAGLEAPCPPLPRVGRVACCPAGADGHRRADCQGGACPVMACVPGDALPPTVGPCLVCDGGDAGPPARPVGEHGLANLTSGDTVARFEPADGGPDAGTVRVVASNCACVFAPRFGAVREVVRPLERSAPEGPRGVAADAPVAVGIDVHVVSFDAQAEAVEAARRAVPGVAVEERLGPLAVDQGDAPHVDAGAAGPHERVADNRLEMQRGRQRPLVQVGFDVPVAWTCVRAANVLVREQAPQVVASDLGTATLRFEEPGRAELTLCKRAGSDTARPGEELDFTIYLLNSGDRPLERIVLADALPARLDLMPGSAASSLPAAFSTGTGNDGAVVLTWRLEQPLEPGMGGFVRFRTRVR